MKRNTKWTVAKVIGAGLVGAVGAATTKKLIVGSTIGVAVVGAAVSTGFHEALDAPLSGWVYKQI